MGELLPSQAQDDGGEDGHVDTSPSLDTKKTPGVRAQAGGAQTWVNTDFYAQVSNVMPSGGVVLSPGQQVKIQEAATKMETKKKAKDPEDVEDAEEKKEGEGSGYTTESSARQLNTPPCSPVPAEGYRATTPQAAECHQSPYILPDSPQTQVLSPIADYTVVQELDSQHSLLLNPPPRHSPPPPMSQNPLKASLAVPVGYVTPDLLGNLSP